MNLRGTCRTVQVEANAAAARPRLRGACKLPGVCNGKRPKERIDYAVFL